MNIDNFINIKGGSYNDIKKALHQWIELYSDDLETNIKFELYKNGNESYIIVVDKRVNNEKFNFLVNYLRYPEGIEYKISIEGYTAAVDEKLYPKNIQNKKLIVYISDNDKEFDNVFITTEDNETYKIDFGGKVSRINESKLFKLPEIDLKHYSVPEKVSLNKKEIEDKLKERSIKDVEKRFNIILTIIIILTVFNILSVFVIENSDINNVTTFFISLGVGAWLISDYEVLQIRKYYNYCFLLAVAIFGYGLLKRHLLAYDNLLSNFGSLFPLVLLILQKPLRLIFIHKFNKEPIVDKEAPIFWDGIYAFILFFSTIAIITGLVEVMK